MANNTQRFLIKIAWAQVMIPRHVESRRRFHLTVFKRRWEGLRRRAARPVQPTVWPSGGGSALIKIGPYLLHLRSVALKMRYVLTGLKQHSDHWGLRGGGCWGVVASVQAAGGHAGLSSYLRWGVGGLGRCWWGIGVSWGQVWRMWTWVFAMPYICKTFCILQFFNQVKLCSMVSLFIIAIRCLYEF